MLVHQLRGDSAPTTPELENYRHQWSIEDEKQIEDEQLAEEASAVTLMQTSLNVKHCNSFNSGVLEVSPNSENCDSNIVSNIDKRLSADTASILGESPTSYYI